VAPCEELLWKRLSTCRETCYRKNGCMNVEENSCVVILCTIPDICLERLRKTTRKFSQDFGAAAEIRTGHHPSTFHKRYRFIALRDTTAS
jgi:hypothetical protein